MPHATGSHDSVDNDDDDDDDTLIHQILNPVDPTKTPIDFNRELELGEKADDAVDFGDLSDNDLADDNDADDRQVFPIGQSSHPGTFSDALDALLQDGDLLASTDGNGFEDDGMDDLFGENPSSPVEISGDKGQSGAKLDSPTDVSSSNNSDSLHAQSATDLGSHPYEDPSQPPTRPIIFSSNDAPSSREQQIQMDLFNRSKLGQDTLPAPPENQEELLASLWPKFKRGTVPKFVELLAPKRVRYAGKDMLKPPKPVNPTRLSLELAQDQEKGFKTWPASNKRTLDEIEQLGIVSIEQTTLDEDVRQEDVDMDSDVENDIVGGVSWQDLQIVCENWDTRSVPESLEPDQSAYRNAEMKDKGALQELEHDLDHGIERPASKRRKLEFSDSNIIHAPLFSFPSLHDPQLTTSKIAQSITLDLNDPQLLVDYVHSSVPSHSVFGRSDLKRAGHGAFTKGLSRRYNISNDEAYDLLKENHQSKVRSMLGNVAVEHSLPAIRLQWPFYKTKLDKQDARAFHRPILKVFRNEHVSFVKSKFVKRKHLKAKGIQSIFHDSKDLSLGDNSNLLLLEYSEEYPTMLSNVGMGNRVINYYRRKTMEDTSRPKLDIGETAVLLPQDKSPFSMFGHVDPGQTTPALYNGMYRAPIFKQVPKSTDFLAVRTTTGVDGCSWFLRNIDNLYAVGQEFPSVDVPGPHSRKVTTASKNRLKMISYRLIRKNKSHRINVGEVTSHFTDTTDMQNRQKMKEFMQFNKEHKEWQMRPGESIPDEDAVRSMVKPEDVCLLESMQVGQQHLQDAGFNKEDDESEDDLKEGQSIEQQLAPWFTSRNFLHATQGKAMLALHGEGDPTGRSEAFSFIKTSMKGGFKAAEASATEKMRAKQMKDSNGHAYNVQEQQKSYEQSIRRTWEAQKQSLSSTQEPDDLDMDKDPIEEASKNALCAGTPRSEAHMPDTIRRRDDETASQFTQHSTGSQSGRVLEITRTSQDESGALKTTTETVRDARVIRQYLRRRQQKEEELLGLSDLLTRTGDPEQDRRKEKLLAKELSRLEKNKERRLAREKGKGVRFDEAANDAGSPSSPAAGTPKTAGTQRKCANCGQQGHIKTNKKLCPMLNGTLKPEEGFNNSAFTMGTPAT